MAFLSMSLLVSCSGNGPEGVAKKFLDHTNKGEFTEAKEYCDEQTAKLLNMAESLGGDAVEELKKQEVDVEILSSEVSEDGNTAKVRYKSTENGEVTEKEIDLIKIDGDWKVTMNKEDTKKEGKPATAE